LIFARPGPDEDEQTNKKGVCIKKRSKVPGVMITQYVEELPEGKSTPDFLRKPIALTIQEGKLAVFKARVSGDPKPEVSWRRAKGDITDIEKFQNKFDETTGEYTLEIAKVSGEESDTYKCYAVNEYGKAICTATLNIIEVGFKKKKAMEELDIATTNPAEFRKMLRKSKCVDKPEKEQKDGEVDEKFWEILMSAERKDYERICAEYGVKDLRVILKKLGEKKQEREEEQAKDGVMIPFEDEMDLKHSLKTVGKKLVFSIKDLNPEDAGLYQVDVEEVNLFSTDFKPPKVDFIVKIQEVKAKEREDAVFECVLSHPMSKIKWTHKNNPLEDGEKYNITVSEDKLIHRLLVKDCLQLDKGIYGAVVGINSCSAWLIVQADTDPGAGGKKKARKTTQAGGSGIDLEKLAQEQHDKLQKEKEERMEAIKKRKEEAESIVEEPPSTDSVAVNTKQEQEPVLEKPKAVKQETSKKAKESGKIESSGDEKTKVEKLDDRPKPKPTPKVPEKVEVEDIEPIADDGDRRKRPPAAALPDTDIDPGVQFICGLSDVNAIKGETAELVCKLSREDCEGAWFKDGVKISPEDGLNISKDGSCHKLVINNCQEDHSGKYRFEADGRKTEAMINIKDPPRFDPDDLARFSQPIIVKVGQSATFKLPFVGCEPMKIQWYREGEELLNDTNTKIEMSSNQSRLLLSRCQRKETGEIKIKLKNEHGTIEALSQLVVLDKPTAPQGPVEIAESSATCIDIKWRPPKDDGGSPIKNYIMERQQVGRNTWKKIGEIPGVSSYRDTDVDHGRKYCYRIRALTEEGISDMMETDDITAGTLAFPGPPAPPKVVSAFNDCINLTWVVPANTGGSRILGYHLEKRKKGSNLWSSVNPVDEPITEKKYAVKDVVVGMEYEFRVAAINISGLGEASNPSEFVVARDPKKRPGKVEDLKLTDTSYTNLSLAWSKPRVEPGVQDEPKGYFVEIRQADCLEWSRCNSTPIILTAFTVKGLKAMAMYWVRVISTNEGGEGVPTDLDNYVTAMPPPVRPRFTDNKMKSFLVVKAGNSVRITINFVASPQPDVVWLKDSVPMTKRLTISNSDGSSQMLIPSSERSDSGIYSILVKNLVGQETFSVEVRVTDDPKPPGPVELEEKVPGTVTIIWESSPDEKRDDHLHYTISKLDSSKHTWSVVADRLFNNNYTVCNILPGREYHFRVYAKNDMGMSAPSESATWGTERRREKFVLNIPEHKNCDLRTAPAFIVPLKQHTAPKGYECYMSCAVKGNPKPRITWYRNNISLNTNTNYYINNICGVCSMLILRVGPKDMGEYSVTAENALGRAECSTNLTVRG
ncbi:immunoglobulin-like and fibronectin type III domain-containing protein 1, partial [Aplochiton taeniatus]